MLSSSRLKQRSPLYSVALCFPSCFSFLLLPPVREICIGPLLPSSPPHSFLVHQFCSCSCPGCGLAGGDQRPKITVPSSVTSASSLISRTRLQQAASAAFPLISGWRIFGEGCVKLLRSPPIAFPFLFRSRSHNPHAVSLPLSTITTNSP